LEGAVAAAQDGDTIVIHGDGPFPTRPIAIQGKTLAIKAAPGYQPRIVFVPEKDDPIWQPLLTSDRALTLEGLDLCEQPGTTDPDKPKTTHLVYCEHAGLHLKSCRLLAPHSCALVVCRRPPRLEIEDCRIVAHTAALCIEAGSNSGSEINLRGNRLAIQGTCGTALSLWETKTSLPSVVRLHIEDSRVQADRIITLTATTSEIEMNARGNQFEFNNALLACTGFTKKGDALFAPPPSHSRSQTWGEKRCPFFRWHGENNRYHATGNWFSVDGKSAGIQNLRAWSELWQSTEAGSSEGSALSTSEPSLSAATHQAAFSK
jgi:hypothetical protein